MKASIVVNAASIAVLGLTAAGTYTLKHNVEQTAQQLRSLKSEIADEQDNISVLNAEWAHLNRPERLEELSRRYLTLEPLPSNRIVAPEDVPAALNRTDN